MAGDSDSEDNIDSSDDGDKDEDQDDDESDNVDVDEIDMQNELTTKFKYMHISEANLWKGNTLTDQIMRFWLKRQEKRIHEYSLVGYILFPNLTIMAHAREHKAQNHENAAEMLINKLIRDQSLVGNKRRVANAKLIDTFLTEYGEFINKRGHFAGDHIWILASEPDLKTYGISLAPKVHAASDLSVGNWENLLVLSFQRF